MPDEACFTCNYIQTTFADQISRGNTYRCSHCGKPIGKPPSVPPSSEQFWLLTGEVPGGPFTVAQVHAELAAGRADWQTLACPVGGSTWFPLVRTPGIGPTAGPDAAGPERSPGASAAKPPDLPVAAKPDGRFWLLVGTETIGPLRAADIRYKLQAGELSPDAKARRVGTDVWVPLTEAVGALPPRLPAAPKPPPAQVPPAGGSASPAAAPAAPLTPGTPDGKAELVGVAIGIGILLLLIAGVGYGVYWAYEQLRPYTATEVCKKLDEAGTAAEAKKYATPRTYPMIDTIYADKSALDPNDTFEWTQEVDGPRPNTKLVGFRGAWFDREAGRRVRVEGHCVAVKSDGWKVDDMVFTGVEGASLAEPVSLVDEHRKSVPTPKGAGTGTTPPKAAPRSPAAPAPGVQRNAHEAVLFGIKKLFVGIIDTIGWGGIGVIVVVVVVGISIRESTRKKPTP